MEFEDLVTLGPVADKAAEKIEELERILPRGMSFAVAFHRCRKRVPKNLNPEVFARLYRAVGYLEGAADAFDVEVDRYVGAQLDPETARYEAGVLESTATHLSLRRDRDERADAEDYQRELQRLEERVDNIDADRDADDL